MPLRHIIVCIKQVPGTSQVEIDPETGVLKRDGIESKMNPYDLYALETALQIKQKYQAEITAVTMGPPHAEEVLREAFMMGVDHAVLISDRKFGGADVLATSRTISQGILSLGAFDLIICGKQTTDGDTAQVGAELAEFLGIPHVSCVSRIGEISNHALTVDADQGISIANLKIQFPCLITVEKGIFEPRLPSFKRQLATSGKEIRKITLADMKDTDPMHYGLNGSPTQVKRIFPPENNRGHEMWSGPGEELTEKLFRRLDDKKFLQQLR